jgi:hypothetical protein
VTKKDEPVKPVVRLRVLPPERDRISYSEWQLFRTRCEWRWFLAYGQGLRVNDESADLSMGTAVHTAVENLLSKKIPLEEVLTIFRSEIDSFYEKLQPYGFITYGPLRPLVEGAPVDRQYDPDVLYSVGEAIIRHIGTIPEFRDGTVVSMEYKLEEPIERRDAPINFKGFVDCILTLKNGRNQTVMYVMDFKTCKWGWPKSKQDDPNVRAQILIYKHMICKKTGVDPKLVRTYFVLLKKTPAKNAPPVELIKISSSERDVAQAIEAMQSDITKMRVGVYETNPTDCVKPWGVCPFHETRWCPGKGGLVTKTLGQAEDVAFDFGQLKI